MTRESRKRGEKSYLCQITTSKKGQVHCEKSGEDTSVNTQSCNQKKVPAPLKDSDHPCVLCFWADTVALNSLIRIQTDSSGRDHLIDKEDSTRIGQIDDIWRPPHPSGEPEVNSVGESGQSDEQYESGPETDDWINGDSSITPVVMFHHIVSNYRREDWYYGLLIRWRGNIAERLSTFYIKHPDLDQWKKVQQTRKWTVLA